VWNILTWRVLDLELLELLELEVQYYITTSEAEQLQPRR